MAQTTTLEASLSSTSSVVQVTASLGSGGQDPGFREKTLYIQIGNGRVGGPVEYRIDSGDWIFLDEEMGKQLQIDLSMSTLLLRKASPIDSSVPVTVERFAIDSLTVGGRYNMEVGGSPVSVAGVSGLNVIVTAALAAGWSVTGWQWHRVVNGTDSSISGANSAAYTQQAADVVPGVRIYPEPLGLKYTPLGITAKMKEPGATNIGTATAGNATVTIAFTAPTDNGGSAILDYEVVLSDGSTMTVSASPAVYTGKTNGNPYRARVRARNAIGYGPFSAQSNQATPVAQVVAPTFTQQAANQSVQEPAAATFTAAFSDGGATTAIKWQKSTNGGTSWSDISGANSTSYTTPATTSADNNTQFRPVATNSAGTTNGTAATLQVAAIVVSAPVNSVAPTISGTPQVGTQLTGSNGTWSNSPTGYAYQWKRAGTNISGATAINYTPVSADLGAALTLQVTATNSGGSNAATSAATAAVAAAATDTRPRTFIAPGTAMTVNSDTLMSGATRITGGANGGKSGTFNTTTTAGNYGWFAALKTAGTPVFTDQGNNFQGGWTSMGDLVYNGDTYAMYRQDYPNASPTPGTNWSVA